MKLMKLLPAALALVLAVNAAGPVAAQSTPANAGVLNAGVTPILLAQGPGGEFPEDDGPANQEPEPPKPQNPVRKVIEDGKIEIRLGNSRHFGYRIGDHIPMVVLLIADEGVKFDFTSLKQEVLGFDGSDFELTKPALVRTQQLSKGKVLYRIDMTLVTWVPKDGVVFNLDLRYAVDLAVDGKTPNWKRLTTPDFVVSRSWTADNGEALLEGDLESKTSGSSWMILPSLIVACFLVGLWPGLELVKWINRIRPRKVMPPKMAAWKIFDKVFADAKASGFTMEHYKQIASALRRYLGATKGVPIEPATFLEVRDRLESDAQLPLIESALGKCERVIYSREELDDEDNRELYREIEELVPRPWDQQ